MSKSTIGVAQSDYDKAINLLDNHYIVIAADGEEHHHIAIDGNAKWISERLVEVVEHILTVFEEKYPLLLAFTLVELQAVIETKKGGVANG